MVHDDDEDDEAVDAIQTIEEPDFEMLSIPEPALGPKKNKGTGLKRLRREEESSSQASTSGPSEQIVTPRSARSAPGQNSELDKGKGRAIDVSPMRKRPRRSAVRSEPYFQDGPLDNEDSTDEDHSHTTTEASSEESDREGGYAGSGRPGTSTHRPASTALHPRSPTSREPRKKRPKLHEMTQPQIQEQYDYFLEFTHKALGKDVQQDSYRMGTGKLVKQWMLKDVHHMWCEARKKYCRRNLDTMSIMLSTWKVSRVSQTPSFALWTRYAIHGVHGVEWWSMPVSKWKVAD